MLFFAYLCFNNNRRVKCWGQNLYGAVGDGTTSNRNTLNVIGLDSGIEEILSAHGDHTCSLTVTGSVKCWGRNDSGQLGDGTTMNRTPIVVSGLDNGVKALTGGDAPYMCVDHHGNVKCWGGNDFTQLGDGTAINTNSIVDVIGLSNNVKAISSNFLHTCALTTTSGVHLGTKWFWSIG